MLTRCTLHPRFVVSGDSGGGENANTPNTEDTENEPLWPAHTPVKDMQPEQQAAYYKHQARKHENRLGEYGGLTPQQVTDLRADNDRLRAAGQSAEEKAVEDAREAGREEVRAQLAVERVKSAFDRALAGRVPNTAALLDLDRSRFISGDGADMEAIQAWVAENSTAPSGPDLGQGRTRGTHQTGKGVSAGRDLFADSKPSKK